MIKIILIFLKEYMNERYEEVYWNAVKESRFSAFNIASKFLQEQKKEETSVV